jgi:cytochrome c oxidase subunit 2
MSFHVVAREPADFEAWLRAEMEPAADTTSEGARLFVRAGCGACHRIRGLESARGTIGPDLTHVGSRRSIGAATLGSDPASFASWIRDSQHLKPGNRMPAYAVLSDAELMALARYLDALK